MRKTDLADPLFSKVGVGPTSETSPFRTGGLIVWTWTDLDLAWRKVDQADPFFYSPIKIVVGFVTSALISLALDIFRLLWAFDLFVRGVD